MKQSTCEVDGNKNRFSFFTKFKQTKHFKLKPQGEVLKLFPFILISWFPKLTPDISHPIYTFQPFLGDTLTFLGQKADWYTSQLSMPGRTPEVDTETGCLNHTDLWLHLHCRLHPDIQASNIIFKAEPTHPPEETDFSCLYSLSNGFNQYPKPLVTGEG